MGYSTPRRPKPKTNKRVAKIVYRIRLTLYEILTLTIMILGWMRDKICFPNLILKNRTFLTPRKIIAYWGSLEQCCDCGLTHRAYLREKGLFWQPFRPKGYSYRLRAFRKPSEFKTEEEWIK